MRKIKISAASINTTPLDIQANQSKIIEVLQNKEIHQSTIALFPELCITGYGCEDAFYNPWLWKEAFQATIELLPYTVGKVIVVGLPIFLSPHLYNCAAVLSDKKLICLVPKLNLANTGIHYEKRWFQHGFEQYSIFRFGEYEIPFGNYVFHFNDFSMGIEICEDSWIMHKPSHKYTEFGADIILSLGASHFALSKHDTRIQIFKEISRSQNNVFVYSNLNGNEAGKVIFEGGCMAFQNGAQLSDGKRMHFTDYEITNTVVDLDQNHHHKARGFRNQASMIERSASIMLVDYGLRETSESLSKEVEPEKVDRYTAFTNAVSLALWDYLRKTKSKGYTVSLSGGADSAACAILVEIMKRKIEREIPEAFAQYGIDPKKILCTIYQGTKNNSVDTLNAAKALAQELNSIHYEIDITDQVSLVTQKVEDITGISLNWKEHDLPLQNVQARVRSPNVWFLANLFNHLLISTGNRSEASVGYTTMDGDSSGSISPLAGVSKEFVLQWLEYIRNGNEKLLGKVKALELILAKRPSAELKPLEEKQEDEKDLMPYPILQKIEYEYVFNGRNSQEIFDTLKSEIKGINDSELQKWIDKFISMFKRSQWKRDRLPPSFHLDEYGLDPKYSYRFPILT